MTRGILIAGNESALSRAVEAEVAKRVEHFAVSLIPPRFAAVSVAQKEFSQEATDENTRLSIDWNPGSPISARTLVLAAENRLDRIDEAILLCSPPSIRRPASQLPLADVEILINDHIKGWFFLVKELAAVFTSRKSGTLALVYFDIGSGGGSGDAADLLGPSSAASFRALTRGLLAAAPGDPYHTIGFSCSNAGDEKGFAAFVLKHLDDSNAKNNGRLHKFGKFNLFKL